jgi:hypothetical protein
MMRMRMMLMLWRWILHNWHEHFAYSEEVPGGLIWKRYAANNRVKPGDAAGSYIPKHNKPDAGYYRVFVIDRTYSNHRIIWEMHNNPLEDGEQVDHIDGNSRNNKLINLRVVSNKENCYNQSKRSTNKSGITGVHKNDNGSGTWYWVASWMVNGKRTGTMFAIAKYGEEGAKALAIEARENAVAMLKDNGVNITERHGC